MKDLIIPCEMKALLWWVWMCDWHVSLSLCTLNTPAVCPPDRRVWVSHCVNCRSPQILMNVSHFSPLSVNHTSFLTLDYVEDALLRIFFCRRDTPVFSWSSRTVEDTLYKYCDYRTEEQDSWRFHSTRDKKALPQILNPFPLLLQRSTIYFHFLNIAWKVNNNYNQNQTYSVQYTSPKSSFIVSSSDLHSTDSLAFSMICKAEIIRLVTSWWGGG